MKLIKPSFFNNSTKDVAKALIGKYIVTKDFIGKIVETEMYLYNDSASHSFNGKTSRNATMFARPGNSYVYFTYGMHHCFNIVTNKTGIGEAVLIRAVEPTKGIEKMKKNRNTNKIKNLTNGPAKFTQAFNITNIDNGINLLDKNSKIKLMDDNSNNNYKIIHTTRIGIKNNKDLPYRFYILGNKFVSKT